MTATMIKTRRNSQIAQARFADGLVRQLPPVLIVVLVGRKLGQH
jgi:hypothetical protein